jgi:hypothetical protein
MIGRTFYPPTLYPKHNVMATAKTKSGSAAKKATAKKITTPVKRARLTKKAAPKKESPRPKPVKDIAATYNQFKTFEGKQYTGMKIGRSHKWYYDKGEWKETKISPDDWKIHYAVTKRRAGKAPEGSGVPVGTEYNWYILAHQNVKKLNANDYSTELTGIKYKLAHKRADKPTWSASDKAQRKRLIKLFQGMIDQLEAELAETK